MPETKPKAPLTPEELRWRAAARDPDKAKRNLKLQYILLRCAIAASIGWGIYLFRTDVISRSDWLGALGIALSLVSILLGIVNNRRILVGKRPWGWKNTAGGKPRKRSECSAGRFGSGVRYSRHGRFSGFSQNRTSSHSPTACC